MVVDRHEHLSSDEERIPQQTVKGLTDAPGLGILKGNYTIAFTRFNCRKYTSNR
jgi:hypothetical protein